MYNVQFTVGAATVQSLAGQSSIPASLLSNAINMAASLSNSSASNSILTNSGKLLLLSSVHNVHVHVSCFTRDCSKTPD